MKARGVGLLRTREVRLAVADLILAGDFDFDFAVVLAGPRGLDNTRGGTAFAVRD